MGRSILCTHHPLEIASKNIRAVNWYLGKKLFYMSLAIAIFSNCSVTPQEHTEQPASDNEFILQDAYSNNKERIRHYLEYIPDDDQSLLGEIEHFWDDSFLYPLVSAFENNH